MGNIEDGPSLDFWLVSTQYAKAAVQYALKMRCLTIYHLGAYLSLFRLLS
jgi:hypothetical protein